MGNVSIRFYNNKLVFDANFVLFLSEIFSFSWFSKRLKMTYRITTYFVTLFLYFSYANQYSLGGGSISIMFVPNHELFLLSHSYQT